MSTTATETSKSKTAKKANAPVKKANERPQYGPQRRGRGPMGGGMGRGATEKALNFGPSLKRLVGYLRPELVKIIFVVIFGACGVALNVYAPKVLGKATDVIFGGVIGKIVGNVLAPMQTAWGQVCQGVDFPFSTKDQIIGLLQDPSSVASNPALMQCPAGGQVLQEAMQGQGGAVSLGSNSDQMLDMIKNINFTPGAGIDFHHLAMIIFFAIGLYIVSAALSMTMGWMLNGIVQRTVYAMRRQVAGKLDALPLSYFDKSPRGELLSRVTNDIDNISQSLQQTMQQMVQSILMVIGVLIMMLTISWELTLIALITIPVAVIVVMQIAKRSQRRFTAMWASTGELTAQVEEAYTGHALVKVFGRHREVEKSFNDENQSLFEAAFGAQFISGIIQPAMTFVGNIGYVAIAVIGCLKVASGSISLGDVQAFIQYQRQFTQPINQIASMANLLQSGVASAERVFEVLDEPEQTPDGLAHLPEPLQGGVNFEHVAFSYEEDKPLITDLSLTAKPGQTIAIVGPTGAGKTTLVNLLMRFYDINSGTISLDEVDTVTVPRAELRGEVGMVLQDTWLFNGTIRDNILYGRPDATQDELMGAAKATYVDRFVRSLPEGYDTVIDEEGSNVSAGEKQLLTIARAFLADPAILVLDEATSSVDTRTEVLVQKAMGALRQGRTSFVIAHRLSTIRDADMILVMQHGDIVEQGNHESLLVAKGAYYELYQSQFAGQVEDD